MILKLLSFAVLIVLASIGLGINGAIFPTFRRQDFPEPKIEMVESREEDEEMAELEIKE